MIYLADLPVVWLPGQADFAADFVLKEAVPAVPVLTLRNQEMLQGHGIRYLNQPEAHLLCGFGGSLLTANKQWTEAALYSGDCADPWHTLPLAAICARFAAFDTILLHGSFVDWKGMGIVFTGSSGVGKTTQAKLWEKYAQAEIVNGDKVFLRILEEKVTAFGLPWTGSSPYGLNRKAALSAIFVLCQGKENEIRQLSGMEVMERLLPQVFLPHWDDEAVTQALETVSRIAETVPIWFLTCRPDAEAVRLAQETLAKKAEVIQPIKEIPEKPEAAAEPERGICEKSGGSSNVKAIL